MAEYREARSLLHCAERSGLGITGPGDEALKGEETEVKLGESDVLGWVTLKVVLSQGVM